MLKLFLKSFVLFFVVSNLLNYLLDDEIYYLKNLVIAILFSISYSILYTRFIKRKCR